MLEHMTAIQGSSLQSTDVPVFCRYHKPFNHKTMKLVTNRKAVNLSSVLRKQMLTRLKSVILLVNTLSLSISNGESIPSSVFKNPSDEFSEESISLKLILGFKTLHKE